MQYRGGNLPLVSIDDAATVEPLPDLDDFPVIVFHVKDHAIGLLATGPVDTKDISADFDTITLKQPGIKGSTIINGQTTMLIDIVDLVRTVRSEWFDENGTPLPNQETINGK